MQPTSVRGIRRQIARKQKAGKSIPLKMLESLEKAIQRDGNRNIERRILVQIGIEKKQPVFRPTKAYGRGRKLAGNELIQRIQELTE